MKGIQGLVIALVLGLLGGILNLYWLNLQAEKTTKIEFLIAKKDIGKGEAIDHNDLTTISIPKDNVGNLAHRAYFGKSKKNFRETAPHKIKQGQLLLKDDFKTPSDSLGLNRDRKEVGIPVPIDSHTPTRYIVPGHTPISFDLSVGVSAGGDGEILGPFEVLAVGDRTGKVNVGGGSQRGSNVLMIVARNISKKKGVVVLDSKTKRLKDHLRRTNNRPLSVVFDSPVD